MHNLTLSQISTVTGFSPNYFCNIFKACTGKSVSAYLTDLRIQQAKRLLTTTSKSINLIAEDVGYESSSYFIKIFKTHMHQSPYQYLKSIRFENALKLLEYNIPIHVIAEKTGFESAEAFSKSFRKEYGKSPSAFYNKNIE